MESTVNSVEEMQAFAVQFLSTLTPRANATIIGLSGELGAGKTTFTKAFAGALGVKDEILSPTFVLAKYYRLFDTKWQELVHIDAYRIEEESELAALRWDELTSDPKRIIVIEWPERLGKHFSGFTCTLKFTFINETTRTITAPL